ncbi:MAG: 2OG-Fe(II) oxygenase, partial [Verrucomicrobiota bacterium]|nr:2OG-Fe(II) oxygenase [Verrucomicrobiota bacterium]
MAAIDWLAAQENLDAHGMACCDVLLTERECRSIADLYEEEAAFRSRVVMSRHGFGQGEYRYFSYPLPVLIQELRASLYARLVSTANRWNELLGVETRFPSDHASFLARCHAAGQLRPTPLLLRYS